MAVFKDLLEVEACPYALIKQSPVIRQTLHIFECSVKIILAVYTWKTVQKFTKETYCVV